MNRSLLVLLGALLVTTPAPASPPAERTLADFADPTAGREWTVVNDDVMGGRSQGDFLVRDDVLVFAGATNTDGGGFSSIRTRPRRLDLADFSGLRLRVRGDGRTYTFRLTTTVAHHGRHPLPYRADFETRAGVGWQTVDVAFAAFRPRWRGRVLDGPALAPGQIDTLGIQIYDKRDGPFRLEVDWIRAYRAPPPFDLAQYVWSNRPLLVFAPHENDGRLRRQLADVARTRAEFDDRAMLLVVVAGDAGRAEGRALSAADAEALRARFGVADQAFAVLLVGKDGGVKRTRAEVVEMSSIYGLIDTMPMRQREMRSR